MNRRRIILLLVGTILMLGWAHAVGAQTKPSGEFVWAQHVTMAPSWFDPAENGGLITPFALERMFEHPAFLRDFTHMLALLRHMIRCTPDPYQEWHTTASSVPALLTTLSFLSPELEQLCDAYALDMQHLRMFVQRSEPEIFCIWGGFLSELLTIRLYQLLGLEVPAGWGRHIAHLEPGHPVERKPNGDYSHLEHATPAQRQVVEQYLASQQPSAPGRQIGSNAMPPNFLDRVRTTYSALLNAPDAKIPVSAEDVALTLARQFWARKNSGRSFRGRWDDA